MTPERKLQISDGMAIWLIPIDSIVERDKNARVMDPDKFKQLIENIKDEGMLESLPLVHKKGEKFEIISGHHRIRASRQAKISVVPCIVIERELTEAEIASKQLSHNSIEGYDDKELLREIYESIDDMSAKLRTALTDEELKIEEPTVPLLDIDIEFGYEPIYILFTKPQIEKFNEMVDKLDKHATKYLADYKEFRDFRDTVQRVSEHEGIRNVAGIMSFMVDVVEKHFDSVPAEEPVDD